MTLRHKETCFDEDRPAVVPFGFDKSKAMYDDAMDFEMAIATHARKLVEADDLESLVWDLYHAATPLDRMLDGKPKGGDEGSLLMLNRRLRELRLAVDGECDGMSKSVDVLGRIAACWGKDSPEYAAVAELVDAIKEDEEIPYIVEIHIRDRKDGEPEGYAWWPWKRCELESRNYFPMDELNDGTERFCRTEHTERLTAALARVQGESP